MSVSIAVIDYGAGNLRSIRRALEAAGAEVTVSSDSGEVRQADAVVFPGVGAAGAAMDRLHQLGLVDVIGDVVAEERPFLGICLGMQLLFEHQEEGDTRGLGLLRGRRFWRGDIALRVPPGKWSDADEFLTGLGLDD